ncbi:MAG: aminotransferase class IV [Desulfobacteraceae bacterium]|jgi:branched-chain amino acid aminotransferase
MANIYYIDGQFLPADQAVIPVDDLAVVRGIGAFDLVRIRNGRPLFLNEHIERLYRSAAKIGLDMIWSRERIRRVVLETLSRNTVGEANIRIIVTGGSSPDFITPKGNPRLLVLVTPLPAQPYWWRTKGVKVITLNVQRSFPGAKSIDYLPAAIALRRARSVDAIEAIYLDDQDNAQEGTTSNLFIVSGGTLVTPGRDVLSGITRRTVLDIAKAHYPVEIRDLPKGELLAAQEVFITGTNKGLVPVVQVDDQVIGSGRPGPVTRDLIRLLDQYDASPK